MKNQNLARIADDGKSNAFFNGTCAGGSVIAIDVGEDDLKIGRESLNSVNLSN
jgi:hypothetical protein